MRDRNLFKGLSISISWIWLGLFALVPCLMVLAASFMTRGETQFIIPSVTLDNYRRMLNTLHLEVFWSSAYLAAGTTVFCLIPGIRKAKRTTQITAICYFEKRCAGLLPMLRAQAAIKRTSLA